MFRTALRNVFAHKARLLMTVLAVMLGVAFVSGTLVFTETISDAFQKQLRQELRRRRRRRHHAPVRRERRPGEDARASTSRPLDKAAQAARRGRPPPASSPASPASPTRTASSIGDGWSTQGANYSPGKDGKDARYPMRDGAAPQRRARGRARRQDRRPGPATRSATPSGSSVNGPVTRAEARRHLHHRRRRRRRRRQPRPVRHPDRAEAVRASPAVRRDRRQGRSRAPRQSSRSRPRSTPLLPKGTPRPSPAQELADDQAKQIASGMSGIKTTLLVFAGIALFVGIFIIANTFTMLVAQRTKELALLRAVGASRRQVTRSVLIEALVVGAVAAVDRAGRRHRHRRRAALADRRDRRDACPTARWWSRPATVAGRARSSASSSPCWPPGCRPAGPRRSRRSPR